MSGPRIIGRYAIYGEIAAGGMATVHLGRLLGPVGFSRMVAIKQLHPRYARDPDFVSMLLDEANVASRIQHPNVVSTIDVVAENDELLLVMDYVQGETLARLLRLSQQANQFVPVRIAAAILSGVLHGLHAAHEAKDTRGELLNVVHRDVSPQNIMVGADGVARVLDFGVAKASGRVQTTREGHLKGKLAYMSTEQLSGVVTRQSDVFAAAIVLWEMLTCRRLFHAEHEGQVVANVMTKEIEAPSTYAPDISPALDAITLCGLDRDLERRFASAREMALAIEESVPLAAPSEIGEWVMSLAGAAIADRAARLAGIESTPHEAPPQPSAPPPPPVRPELFTISMPGNEPLLPPLPLKIEPPAPVTPPRSRWIGLAVALSVGLLIGAASLYWVRPSRVAPRIVQAESAPSASSPETPLPSAAPIEGADVPAISPSASAAPAHAPSPTARPRAPKPRPLAPNLCDPPYVRSPDGKLVPKPGCL